RADHHAGARVAQRAERGQHRPDPAVVGDAAAVEGHVQVGAQQHPPPRHALAKQVVECPHHRDAPTYFTTSTRRLEKPHSLSYQPTTLTWLPITFVSRESKMQEAGSVTMSVETIGSSV